MPSEGAEMSDRIRVDRIAIYAYHGVHAAEEKLGQRFYVTIECGLDLQGAGRDDDWSQTVCYGQLTEIVNMVTTGRRFKIIEALAEAIAAKVLEVFGQIETITVRVEKPSAPVPAIIDGVTVEITRWRHA
jgi:7,8-dihydroneopterin aldolase/epimerase/oxygenase